MRALSGALIQKNQFNFLTKNDTQGFFLCPIRVLLHAGGQEERLTRNIAMLAPSVPVAGLRIVRYEFLQCEISSLCYFVMSAVMELAEFPCLLPYPWFWGQDLDMESSQPERPVVFRQPSLHPSHLFSPFSNDLLLALSLHIMGM